MTFLHIDVETKNGAIYGIPSMPEAVVVELLSNLEKFGRGASSNLTLITQDQVAVVIPWRIVQVIRVEKVEKWRCLV